MQTWSCNEYHCSYYSVDCKGTHCNLLNCRPWLLSWTFLGLNLTGFSFLELYIKNVYEKVQLCSYEVQFNFHWLLLHLTFYLNQVLYLFSPQEFFLSTSTGLQKKWRWLRQSCVKAQTAKCTTKHSYFLHIRSQRSSHETIRRLKTGQKKVCLKAEVTAVREIHTRKSS